jgi:Phage tail assembly chaperone proteins, E, or 41 or 14
MTDNTETFTLSAPLKTHSGEITELKLKEPRAGALVKYNDPFKVKPIKGEDGETSGFEFEFSNKPMMQFLAEMTGIDEIILSKLSVSDFMRVRVVAANIVLMGINDKNPS